MANVKISALTAITGASVDQANDVIPIVDATGPETKKITVEELIGLANPGLTYTEVNITSAEILLLNTNGKTLLATPADANTYYDIERINIEYTHVTTAYTLNAGELLTIGKDSYSGYQPLTLNALSVIGSAFDTEISGLRLSGGSVDSTLYFNTQTASPLQKSLSIGCLIGDPTLGDGTMKVKIWYYIRTFG